MALAPINPTNLTPPRVDFLDPRTGAISREWYRFFLSLLTATQTNQQETELAPDAASDVTSVQAGLDALAQASAVEPRNELGTLAALAQASAVEPRNELGTLAALQQANVPWLTFSTAPSPVSPDVGTVRWDGGTTLNVQMTPNVLGRVNEDLFYYIKATAAITKGQVVMFTGAVGSSGVATGAPATGVTDGTYIMGVAAENIALNGFGLVQYNGTLRGIDTSAFADGDILWYDPAVTGGLTDTVPTAPNIKVQIAAVVNAGPGSSGSILIRVNPGSTLGGTDSNVQFGPLSNNDLIQYYAAGGYWRNISTLNVSSGGTGANTLSANYLLKGNGTSAIQASIAYDNGGALGVNTTAAAGRLQVALDTSFTWGGVWGLGTAVFGGAASSSGALAISYNDTDGGTIGAITPGTAWRPVRVFSDNIQFCTNGSTEQMRVTSAGRVGIGTATPSTLLHLSSAAPIITLTDTDTGANSRISADSGSGGLTIAADINNTVANSALFFSVDNTERMRLDASGNLMVATTTASSTSTLNGFFISGATSALFSRRTSGAAQVHFTIINGGTTVGSVVSSTTATTYNTSPTSGVAGVDANTVALRTNSAERMRITSAGEVGIATSTPAGRLHTQLDTTFSWGGGWNTGVAAFGGGTSTAGALAISYNNTDGAALGAIEPGVAWRKVSIFSDLVDLCSNGTNARLRVKPNGQVRFIPLASAPAGAEAGDVYYDSGTNKLRCYDGTIWNDLF